MLNGVFKDVLMSLARYVQLYLYFCSLASNVNASTSNFVGYCKVPQLFGRTGTGAHSQDYSTGGKRRTLIKGGSKVPR